MKGRLKKKKLYKTFKEAQKSLDKNRKDFVRDE